MGGIFANGEHAPGRLLSTSVMIRVQANAVRSGPA